MPFQQALGPRPDHPDFWRLSEILLQLNARATEDGRRMIEEIGETVDFASVDYFARGRTNLAVNSFVADSGGKLTAREVMALLEAAWLEAFLVGVRFQERGGKQ